MKNIIVTAIVLLVFNAIHAQSYLCFAPCVTNSPGTLAEKSNLSLEAGRQWDVFSIGLDIGKSSLGKIKGRDTTLYIETRPNLNIFQQGKFTNTFTPGIGVIFNAKENLMTEFTSGIEYAYTPLIHFNVYFGQFYYSGRESASTVTFFGVSVMKYFSPMHSKALITNNPR